MARITPIRRAFVAHGTNAYGPALFIIVPNGQYVHRILYHYASGFRRLGYHVDSFVHQNSEGESVILLQFDPEIDEENVSRHAREL